MNWLEELTSDKKLQACFSSFMQHYGTSGLEQALQFYTYMQQEYICKTKKSISRLKISDIYYIEVKKHIITIHTDHETYQKYGSLSQELKRLSQYNFIKCSQSCIVSLEKIKTIQKSDITLTNNEKIHMSRICAPQILIAFSNMHTQTVSAPKSF